MHDPQAVKRLVIAVLLIGSLAQAAKGNLILNGSFEEGDYTSPIGWQRVYSGSNAIRYWAVGGVAVDWHQDFVSAHDGNRVVDLHLDGGQGQHGSLSQSFSTEIGREYVLTFYLAGPGREYGLPDPRRVIVDVAGQTFEFQAQASSHLALEWFRQSATFVAVGTETTLTFRSATDSTTFWGPVIDSVSVVPSEIPEPSSVMVVAGLIALLGVKRLHRE